MGAYLRSTATLFHRTEKLHKITEIYFVFSIFTSLFSVHRNFCYCPSILWNLMIWVSVWMYFVSIFRMILRNHLKIWIEVPFRWGRTTWRYINKETQYFMDLSYYIIVANISLLPFITKEQNDLEMVTVSFILPWRLWYCINIVQTVSRKVCGFCFALTTFINQNVQGV